MMELSVQKFSDVRLHRIPPFLFNILLYLKPFLLLPKAEISNYIYFTWIVSKKHKEFNHHSSPVRDYLLASHDRSSSARLNFTEPWPR